jgi:hypothetical protein
MAVASGTSPIILPQSASALVSNNPTSRNSKLATSKLFSDFFVLFVPFVVKVVVVAWAAPLFPPPPGDPPAENEKRLESLP